MLNGELYLDVYKHFESTKNTTPNLSDTWAHTLSQKYARYTIQELLTMRHPSSRVGWPTVDSNFSVDSSLVDLSCSVTKKILNLGETDFGGPNKDVIISGRQYSSLFLREVTTATKIIELIEDAGVTQPHVLEIGGGLGLNHYILRNYFGDRLTFFAVDIPETLLIQEFFIRGSLPAFPTYYKGTVDHVDVSVGGSYFVNAYSLGSQNIFHHVAVNIDSMQEMSADTAREYIRYLEKNISKNGIFFFQNHHGHSATSIPHPYDYELDKNWRVGYATVVSQFQTCSSSEQLRVVFQRTNQEVDVQFRKNKLREIWETYYLGRDIVLNLSKGSSNRVEWEHFSPNQPLHYLNEGHRGLLAAHDGLINTMERVGRKDMHGDAIPMVIKERDAILKELFEVTVAAENSEYFQTYIACIFSALGEKLLAKRVLDNISMFSFQPTWLLRVGFLFGHNGFVDEMLTSLQKCWPTYKTNTLLSLQAAELLATYGKKEESDSLISTSKSKCEDHPVLLIILFEIALALNDDELIDSLLPSLVRYTTSIGILPILNAMLKVWEKKQRLNILDIFTKSRFVGQEKAFILCSLLRGGDLDDVYRDLENAVKAAWGDYFKLAWIGEKLLRFGYGDLAESCFRRSVMLRPGNFMHHMFIGDVYLQYGWYSSALEEYQEALKRNQYPRYVRARQAFCKLDTRVRESGIFGRPSNLDWIYQQGQGFYGFPAPNWS